MGPRSTIRRAHAAPWGLALALVGLAVVAVGLGANPMPPGQVLEVLSRGPSDGAQPTLTATVFALRLPRVALAALVGASLAVSGTTLQGLFRNPLADPYVLGVSAGGALGAASGLVLSARGLVNVPGLVPLLAFAGAGLALWLVVLMARGALGMSLGSVLLSGVAVGLTLSAGLSWVIVAARREASEVVLWLMGSLSGASARSLPWVAGCLAIGLALPLWHARDLDLLLEGEDSAAALGVEVEAVKRRLLVASALLVAGAVAFCGVIGFVGLVVPHGARLVVGPRHRRLLVTSALGGALLLLSADTLARTAFAAELPVGVLTGFIGGSFFLVLLKRSFGHARGA